MGLELNKLVEESVLLIKRAEKLAMAMQPNQGFCVGFSGGKDSQVLLELVKMAGVKYRAVYSVTTNDPADNVRFIRTHYPEVEFSVPSESFFQMVARVGVPSIKRRWCCAVLKEREGLGSVVLTGVRASESNKRATYTEVCRWKKHAGDGGALDLEVMEAREFRCVGGKDKIMIYPMLRWSERNVWDFIRHQGLPINPCYEYRSRVGCVFCPFAKSSEIIAYCEAHPKLKRAFLNAIEKNLHHRDGDRKFESAEDLFEWWLSKDTYKVWSLKKKQLQIDFSNLK